MGQIAHRRCGLARSARTALRSAAMVCLGGAALVWLSDTAQARAQDPVPDPTILAIEPLLKSESAMTRGEAAIALATNGDEKHYGGLLEVATDRDPAARVRGILALGLLGRPGTDVFLNEILTKSSSSEEERLVAALALGLMPDEPRSPALDEFFNRADGASRRRIRAPLVCVLLGLLRSPHPSRMMVLRRILADATYRDRSILALVVRNLVRIPDPDNLEAIRKLLRTKNPRVAVAALNGLRHPGLKLADAQWKQILRMAERGSDPEIRAAAMDLLTFHRKPDALALARRALSSGEPALVAAAIRGILTLGGGILRSSVERRILATRDQELQSAMMRAKRGPHNDDFVKGCLAIARSAENSLELRISATEVVAAAGWKEVAPTATVLFLAAKESNTAVRLAVCLEKLGVAMDSKIVPRKTVEDVALLPTRLRALLIAGKKDADAMLLHLLSGKAGAGLQLDALKAYRSARLRIVGSTFEDLVAPPIRELLR